MKKSLILLSLTLVLIVINIGLVIIAGEHINLFGVIETTFSGWKFITSWIVIDLSGLFLILLKDIDLSMKKVFDFSNTNWDFGLK